MTPNLVFSDFRIFNTPVLVPEKGSPTHISYASNIILRHKQNYLTFEFTALNYRHQGSIHYSCILEGLEHAWNNLNRERKITYTNLQPGEYIFKVRANASGQRNNTAEIAIPLIIKPPFWRTLVAYSIYALLFLVFIWIAYRVLLNREKRKHSLELERVNARRIHEMDMMKLQFYTNISHELRTPLTLISAPVETLLTEKVDRNKTRAYYQMIHTNVQRLQRLINRNDFVSKAELFASLPDFGVSQ